MKTLFSLLILFGATALSADQKIRLGDVTDEAVREELLFPTDPNQRRTKTKDNLTLEESNQLRSELVEEFYAEGTKALAKGELEQAEAYFDRVLILKPKHPGAKAGLAKVMQGYEVQKRQENQRKLESDEIVRKQKELEQALVSKHFENALKAASAKEEAGETTAALRLYKQAARFKQTPFVQSKIQELSGRVKDDQAEAAETLYREALKANQLNDTAKAADLCRQALKINPAHLQAQRMLERLAPAQLH